MLHKFHKVWASWLQGIPSQALPYMSPSALLPLAVSMGQVRMETWCCSQVQRKPCHQCFEPYNAKYARILDFIYFHISLKYDYLFCRNCCLKMVDIQLVWVELIPTGSFLSETLLSTYMPALCQVLWLQGWVRWAYFWPSWSSLSGRKIDIKVITSSNGSYRRKVQAAGDIRKDFPEEVKFGLRPEGQLGESNEEERGMFSR